MRRSAPPTDASAHPLLHPRPIRPHLDRSSLTPVEPDPTPSIWETRPTTLRKKQVGKSLVYCERYLVGRERRYYIEANGPDYRIWKRIPNDEDRAIEVYRIYRFWVWFIEAFDTHSMTRLITWVMHKLV